MRRGWIRGAWRVALPLALGLALALPSLAADAGAADLVARGEYLTAAGDCTSCHTDPDGGYLAGGHSLPTPFGDIDSPNITPDQETGIGSWSFEDFWGAFHDGRAPGNRLLYPVFPYTSYTKVTRADAEAIFAYLKSIPPVRRLDIAPDLRFPYNIRKGLLAWRALFFHPGEYVPDESQSASWNRGAYLVEGLGHCTECHAERGALGGISQDHYLTGGSIPEQGWYAPDLSTGKGGGLEGWSSQDIADLLKNGISAKGAVFGPMADVVRNSTQHLTAADLEAIAEYLHGLPAPTRVAQQVPQATDYERGRAIYEKSCADCHGADGQGKAGVYLALDGNGTVTEPSGFNAIRLVLFGGFPPVTAGNPEPYSMPPFDPHLNDAEVAAVVNYVRQSWSNRAPAVTAADVETNRNMPLRE